jgi:hypothetical protein
MKRYLLALGLAVPLAALCQQPAAAGCHNLSGCFHIKICTSGCLKYWCEPFCPSYCGGGGCCDGGGGGYGGGGGGGCCGVGGCPPDVPGPWYAFWPYNGQYQITSAPGYGAWSYDCHFQTPAPTGYPSNPPPMYYAGAPVGGGPAGPAYPMSYSQGFMPVSYHNPQIPSYWYGW